jgi:hypothetical protein
MNSELEKRKSLCANTGSDSQKNLQTTLSSNPTMSIQRSRSGARILCGWVNEARRLHKEARDTKREIHAIALDQHLAGVSEQIGRFC